MSDLVKHACQTDSPAQTYALGQALGECLVGGGCLGLVGDLGAGKTQLVKGMAQGNAAIDPSEVTSPTFTLINEYVGRLQLFHIDAYRLADAGALAALGFDELIAHDAVVVVEWANRVENALPLDRLWIEVDIVGKDSRRFSFQAYGDMATAQLAALRKQLH